MWFKKRTTSIGNLLAYFLANVFFFTLWTLWSTVHSLSCSSLLWSSNITSYMSKFVFESYSYASFLHGLPILSLLFYHLDLFSFRLSIPQMFFIRLLLANPSDTPTTDLKNLPFTSLYLAVFLCSVSKFHCHKTTRHCHQFIQLQKKKLFWPIPSMFFSLSHTCD